MVAVFEQSNICMKNPDDVLTDIKLQSQGAYVPTNNFSSENVVIQKR